MVLLGRLEVCFTCYRFLHKKLIHGRHEVEEKYVRGPDSILHLPSACRQFIHQSPHTRQNLQFFFPPLSRKKTDAWNESIVIIIDDPKNSSLLITLFGRRYYCYFIHLL